MNINHIFIFIVDQVFVTAILNFESKFTLPTFVI